MPSAKFPAKCLPPNGQNVANVVFSNILWCFAGIPSISANGTTVSAVVQRTVAATTGTESIASATATETGAESIREGKLT